jgi:hypothetical protein
MAAHATVNTTTEERYFPCYSCVVGISRKISGASAVDYSEVSWLVSSQSVRGRLRFSSCELLEAGS